MNQRVVRFGYGEWYGRQFLGKPLIDDSAICSQFGCCIDHQVIRLFSGCLNKVINNKIVYSTKLRILHSSHYNVTKAIMTKINTEVWLIVDHAKPYYNS